ncbi:Hypothetical protein CINCED_3A020790 [Cinara cedri]|uniref:Uncharacterized protein n=1 Tax=Cinara cedri TaxID=506608 RepID=A0A5E4M1Q1_9HEMI|nr:Hypothetical protein CINCED_3A020790 [Cinara cedri]
MKRRVTIRRAAERSRGPAAFPMLMAVYAASALFRYGSAAVGRTGPETPVVGAPFGRPPTAGTPSRHDNWTAERVDVCTLNACEAYVRMRDDLANAVWPINEKLRGGGGGGDGDGDGDRGELLEAKLQRLDRRLRSVEQPGE